MTKVGAAPPPGISPSPTTPTVPGLARVTASRVAPAQTYGYDQADRLDCLQRAGLTTASYAYDGDGLRASKTTGGATSRGRDLGSWRTACRRCSRTGAMRYIYGPGGTPVEQVDGAGNVKYYLAGPPGQRAGPGGQYRRPDRQLQLRPVWPAERRSMGSTADTPFGYAGQYTRCGDRLPVPAGQVLRPNHGAVPHGGPAGGQHRPSLRLRGRQPGQRHRSRRPFGLL